MLQFAQFSNLFLDSLFYIFLEFVFFFLKNIKDITICLFHIKNDVWIDYELEHESKRVRLRCNLVMFKSLFMVHAVSHILHIFNLILSRDSTITRSLMNEKSWSVRIICCIRSAQNQSYGEIISWAHLTRSL